MSINLLDKQFRGPFPVTENIDGIIDSDRLTLEGAYVYRRFCVRPVVADLVASLAGLGPNRMAA
jgi:hypothetical protein